jgi:3D (Asp-Asp-Asp) domain-containing protein
MRYLLRRALPTIILVSVFVLLYEATVSDSRTSLSREATAVPAPGARVRFQATAYCKGTTTASGVRVRTGIAAADPKLLPVGSVVQMDVGDPTYDGVYTIMDTGPAVQGRHIDVYMWSCYEALDFGRRPVQLVVLRLGWNPVQSSPHVTTPLFEEREERLRNPSASE